MIVPNKVILYENSVLSKLAILLYLLDKPISPRELYKNTNQYFQDTNQFLLTLDTLFILGKIEILNGDLHLC